MSGWPICRFADLLIRRFQQGEDLGPQHGRIGDAQKLPLPLLRLAAGDDEEPGAVGGGVDVGGLDGAIEPLFLRRKQGKVALRGGSQSFNDHLQRVAVYPVPQVKKEHADLGVGQEQGHDVALAQVSADRVVVGEVAVVHQGLVQADEGVRPARMPHPPFGGIALVGDPDVGHQVFQAVVGGCLLGVAHDFEDQQVSPVAKHEGPLLPQAGVEALVEAEAVLVDELVLHLARREVLQVVLLGEAGQHLRLDPHEVAPHLRRFHPQAGHLPIVVQGGDAVALQDVEGGGQVRLLHLRPRCRIQIGDL